MSSVIHETVPVQVWADVDEGIADTVIYLNTIPGVRTICSCQGTLGEGGPKPYGPYVAVTWANDEVFKRLQSEFDMTETVEGSFEKAWGYVHPRNKE